MLETYCLYLLMINRELFNAGILQIIATDAIHALNQLCGYYTAKCTLFCRCIAGVLMLWLNKMSEQS